MECAIDAFVAMFRTEPGFRIIRFTDAERSGLPGEEEAGADRVVRVPVRRDPVRGVRPARGQGPRVPLEIVVEIMDGLINRAFLDDPMGDPRYIDEARVVAREYLERRYDPKS